MAWFYLIIAGLFEIGWPVGLKLSQTPGWLVGVDPTVVSPTAISITANPGSVHIEVEPTLPSRKCQEDLYDFA